MGLRKFLIPTLDSLHVQYTESITPIRGKYSRNLPRVSGVLKH